MEENLNNNTELSLEEEKPSTFTDLKQYKNEKSYYDFVEEERQVIASSQKHSNKRAGIAMGIIFACCVLCLVFAIVADNNPDTLGWMRYLVWAFVGIGIVILLVFTIINKRIARPDFKHYISASYTAINAYLFKDTEFSEATYDSAEKISLENVYSDGVYKKIESVVSRNVINGKYLGRTFKVAEVGVYKETVKKRQITNFVGKMVFLPNDFHFEGRYLLVKSGMPAVDAPDALDDLVVLYESGDTKLYGPKDAKYKEDLGTKFVALLDKVDVKKHLLGFTAVIWAGKTVCYLSYDDIAITLPFTTKFDNSGVEQFNGDLHTVFAAFKESIKE
ncbi:MAG: hypothetical protein MJ231_08535 [bacterium]|nr:hypothetical protein [bacterium]